LVDKFIQDKSYQEEWQKHEMLHEIHRIYNIHFNFDGKITKNEVILELNNLTTQVIERKKAEFGEEIFNEALKRIFIMTLDQFWKEHLHVLDRLKAGINLRAYGQKDPLNEYKFEAFKLFEDMFLELDESIISVAAKMQISHDLPKLEDANIMQNTIENRDEINSMLNSNIKATPETQKVHEFQDIDPKNPDTWGKVSRNELCPCGSNKKYKHCHGSIV
jgi:preprotein translocase subunit SecA